MLKLSNSSRPTCNSEISRENRNFTEYFTEGEKSYKNIIKQADSVPLIKIFKYYGVKLDEHNRKIICPFSSHKGGQENSASLYYYHQTNSFWCFGCKTGTKCSDFVSAMSNISRLKASYKILTLFINDVNNDHVVLLNNDFAEKIQIMLDFSDNVRDFINTNNFDDKALLFVENICEIYDNINLKHNLNNDALRSVVGQLKERIDSYIS